MTLVLVGLLVTLVVGLLAELYLIRRHHRRMETRMEVYRLAGNLIRRWP